MNKELARMHRILEDRFPTAQFKILCEYNLKAIDKILTKLHNGFIIHKYHAERVELKKEYSFYTIDKDGNMDRL